MIRNADLSGLSDNCSQRAESKAILVSYLGSNAGIFLDGVAGRTEIKCGNIMYAYLSFPDSISEQFPLSKPWFDIAKACVQNSV